MGAEIPLMAAGYAALGLVLGSLGTWFGSRKEK